MSEDHSETPSHQQAFAVSLSEAYWLNLLMDTPDTPDRYSPFLGFTCLAKARTYLVYPVRLVLCVYTHAHLAPP